MPRGISTTPQTCALPPIPLACASFSVLKTFKPCLLSAPSNLCKDSRPINPPWAAVSTTPCSERVVKPWKLPALVIGDFIWRFGRKLPRVNGSCWCWSPKKKPSLWEPPALISQKPVLPLIASRWRPRAFGSLVHSFAQCPMMPHFAQRVLNFNMSTWTLVPRSEEPLNWTLPPPAEKLRRALPPPFEVADDLPWDLPL